jgi:ABC-type nitrate/sulfonate/bicarbonate transport system permease component
MLHARAAVRAIQVLAAVVLLGLWQLVATFVVPKHLLPDPASTISQAWALLGSGVFRSNVGYTLLEFLAVEAIGIPVAMALGFGLRNHFERFFGPAIQIVMSTPQSIFLPIFMFVFGIGFEQKLLFGLTHVLLVTMLTSRAAAKSVPETLIVTGRFYGARRLTLYRRVYMPYMLPMLMQAIRLGLVFGLGAIIVAELYVSSRGVGNLVISYSSLSNIRALMAITLLVGAFAVVMNQSLFFLERRFSRWRS